MKYASHILELLSMIIKQTHNNLSEIIMIILEAERDFVLFSENYSELNM